MTVFSNKNAKAPIEPQFAELRKDLDLDKLDQARLREAILARASITPQDRPGTGGSYLLRFVLYARLALAVVLIFAGLGGVVYASSSALPGTFLYQVKMAKEKVELQLAATPQQKALVLAKHAEIRLDELQKLQTQQPGGSKLPAFSPEVKRQAVIQVNTAIHSLNEVENNLNQQGNQQQAATVHAQIENLSQHARQHGVEAGIGDFTVKVPAIQEASSTKLNIKDGLNQDSQRLDESKASQKIQSGDPNASSRDSQKSGRNQDLHDKNFGEKDPSFIPVQAATTTPSVASTTPQTENHFATSPASSAVSSSSTGSSAILPHPTTTIPNTGSGNQLPPTKQSDSSHEESDRQSPTYNYYGGGHNPDR